MLELADKMVLETIAEKHTGSTPVTRTYSQLVQWSRINDYESLDKSSNLLLGTLI